MVAAKFGSHFSGAVEGRIPTSFEGIRGRVMGKEINPAELAHAIGRGLEAGGITPVNILAQSGAMSVTQVMPGGRKPEELSLSQVEGKVTYKPQDIFSTKPN